MFDKEKFKATLEKALGDRNKTQYADESGVNRTYISKYLNCKLDSPPTPDILKRLSLCAHNGVTYEELMIAAGYIESEASSDDEDEHSTLAFHRADGYEEDLPPEAIEEIEKFKEFIRHKYGKK